MPAASGLPRARRARERGARCRLGMSSRTAIWTPRRSRRRGRFVVVGRQAWRGRASGVIAVEIHPGCLSTLRRRKVVRRGLRHRSRGPRSRGAVGVGDVAGERGDRARALRRVQSPRPTWEALANTLPHEEHRIHLGSDRAGRRAGPPSAAAKSWEPVLRSDGDPRPGRTGTIEGENSSPRCRRGQGGGGLLSVSARSGQAGAALPPQQVARGFRYWLCARVRIWRIRSLPRPSRGPRSRRASE